MTEDKTLHHKLHEEIAKFEKTMEELHMLKNVSKDLKQHKKMLKLKKYD